MFMFLLSKPLLVALLVLCASCTPAAAVTSALWGTSGELWDPATSVLKDFTNVGYKSGNEPIPTVVEWPNGVNVVLDHGAVPDDPTFDNTAAFLAAIAACPDNQAVFVPKGRYRIDHQLRITRDNFVLRGEDMYETVLWFPRNLAEIYPKVDYDDSYGHGFFYVDGGTQRSIENFSLEFREQMKGGHWEFKGANAISYGGDVTDSWIKNIYIKNADACVAMRKAERISVINIILDHSIVRPDMIGSSGVLRWSGHIGFGMNGALYCLFHNIEFRGRYFHEFDIINVPKHSVVSQVVGPHVSLNHHGGGAQFNLYTDINVGEGDRSIDKLDDRNQHNETHWGIYGDQLIPRSKITNEGSSGDTNFHDNHVFVGVGTSAADGADLQNFNNDTFYFEYIDPTLLYPKNIYLAQLEKVNKTLPDVVFPPAPPQTVGDVVRLNPTPESEGGNWLSFGSYLKFDFSSLSVNSVHHARLLLNAKNFIRTPFTIRVKSVADDSWTKESVVTSPPPVGATLDSLMIVEDTEDEWFTFDVTSFVIDQWNGGNNDQIVSLYFDTDKTGTFLGGLRGPKSGNAPQLVIEQVPSSVAGPPKAPVEMMTFSREGHVLLDWTDNTEADFESYNVYRKVNDPFKKHFGQPIATGLVNSDFTDVSILENRAICEIPSDAVIYYYVTAVDDHGYESEPSTKFIATTTDPVNQPPAFSSNPVTATAAIVNLNYAASLVSEASDAEADSLTFFKISGPDWLEVAFDGTISGTPDLSMIGLNEFMVQVNAKGGSDQAALQITVELPADDPVGPPAAPGVLSATSQDNAVLLDWGDNVENDLYGYIIYRRESGAGPGGALATGVVDSQYLDDTVANGVTYFYTVTAIDTNGNESGDSAEVSATPAPPNMPPLFNAEAFTEASAREDVAYNQNIADDASDPESDPMTFSKVSGPAWLVVAPDGALSGTPSNLDLGINNFVVKVEATGGSDTADLDIIVNPTEAGNSFDNSNGNGLAGDAGNWDAGLPDTVENLGTVASGDTVVIGSGSNGEIAAVGLFVEQVDGSVAAQSFLGTTLDNTNWTLSGGTLGSVGVTLKSNSLLTVSDIGAITVGSGRDLIITTGSTLVMDGGSTYVGDELSVVSEMVVNGGMVTVSKRVKVVSGGTFTMNGGVLTVANGGNFGELAFSGGPVTMNFNGGTITADEFGFQKSGTIATFGGSVPGTATFNKFGDDSGERTNPSKVAIDWLAGSLMELSITNEVDWAETLWNQGKLTYMGGGFGSLGTWAQVTAEDGLEETIRFAYNATSGALSLAVDPPNTFEDFNANGFAADDGNWFAGLPNSSANRGLVEAGDSVVVGSHNSGEFPATGLFVEQTGGYVAAQSFLGTTLDNTNWTLSGGTLGSVGVTLKSNSLLTVSDTGAITVGSGRDLIITTGSTLVMDGGSAYVGDELSVVSEMVVNEGTVTVSKRVKVVSGGTFTMNGGVLTVANGGNFGELAFSGGPVTMNFNGGTVTADEFGFQKSGTIATFGGSVPGTATFNKFGDDSGERTNPSKVAIDWLAGSLMELSITNEVDWAETLWNQGKLTYMGGGFGSLGTWAQVTTQDGLETGVYFSYNAVTGTLSLVTSQVRMLLRGRVL